MIFIDLYGKNDKSTLKAKRQISIVLLKNKQQE